jgi:2-dehydropantoate 2-reductase
MLDSGAVLTGATLGAIAHRPKTVAIVGRMMTEAEAVANTLGVVLPQPMEKCVAIAAAAREHRMSMLQDLTRGRPLEIDVLACSIAEMRCLVGLTTPTIDMVLDFARLRGIREV